MKYIMFLILVKYRDEYNNLKYTSTSFADYMGEKSEKECIKIAEDFCHEAMKELENQEEWSIVNYKIVEL